jgi:uncharacterized protein
LLGERFLRRILLEEEINGFEFREFENIGRPKYLILGLPDVGLVGTISAAHIVRSLKLKDVVGIESYAFLPPVVVISNGEPKYPMRIYSDGNIAILVTDVPVNPHGVAPLASAIVEYARRRGVDLIISITGLGSPRRFKGEPPSVYWLASDEETEELVKGISDIEKLSEGILVGPYAIVLKESARRYVKNLVIMVESYPEFPDPEAAAEAVKVFSKITNISIDVSKLLEEAETIKLRLNELMKETRETLARMGKGFEHRPPLIYS